MTKKVTVKIDLPKPGQVVSVRAMRDGYRRCGAKLTKTAQLFPADRFSADQIAQLHADHNLVVTYVDPAPKK